MPKDTVHGVLFGRPWGSSAVPPPDCGAMHHSGDAVTAAARYADPMEEASRMRFSCTMADTCRAR